jgi:hypothetical protein
MLLATSADNQSIQPWITRSGLYANGRQVVCSRVVLSLLRVSLTDQVVRSQPVAIIRLNAVGRQEKNQPVCPLADG